MARNTQTLCDNCNSVLWGWDKAAFMEKPFVEIKGSIILQNEKIGPFKEHIFITKQEERDLCFCDWECVKDWVDVRKDQYVNRKKDAL